MTIEKQESMSGKFLAIIAFVAGIIGILVQGLNGLLIVVATSFVVFVCYYLYEYLSIHRWKNKSRQLFRGLIQPEFLAWQQRTLEQIYPGLEFASVYGKKYPAAILRPEKNYEYPFDGLCQLQSIKLPNYRFDRNQKKYLKILSGSLRAPKMKGYALSRIHYDKNGKTKAFDATTTNQEQNLATCHILEWELFNCYQRLKGATPKNIFKYLPYRARYHNGRDANAAISEPHSAYPLISVQAIVIFRDTRGVGKPIWRVVLAKRSEKVIVKPGFFQFQPAGGFEVYGSQNDSADYLVKQGFDVGDALLREYGEELFNVEEFQENTEGRDAYSIRSHPVVRQLVGAIKRKTAWLEFIGTIFDLTLLRPEFSFLILIEDEFFCKSELLESWESMNIMSPNVEELGSILSNSAVHCSSAGLLQLAIENKRIQKLGIAKSLINNGNLPKRQS